MSFNANRAPPPKLHRTLPTTASLGAKPQAKLTPINNGQLQLPQQQQRQQQQQAKRNLSKARKSRNNCFHNFRFVLIVLSGLFNGLMFMNRMNMSVSIISMVNHTALLLLEEEQVFHMRHDDSNSSTASFAPTTLNSLTKTTLASLDADDEAARAEKLAEFAALDGEFVWTNEVQMTVITAYMFAYTLPQPFLTNLALRIGIRHAIFISMLVIAISSALMPAFTAFGWIWLIPLRCLNAMGASCLVPVSLRMLEEWLAPDEKLVGLIIAQFVANLFTITTPVISGYLCSIHWLWSFQVPAVITLVYSIVWLVLVNNDIEKNTFMSNKEFEYLQHAKAKAKQQDNENDGGVNGAPYLPAASLEDADSFDGISFSASPPPPPIATTTTTTTTTDAAKKAHINNNNNNDKNKKVDNDFKATQVVEKQCRDELMKYICSRREFYYFFVCWTLSCGCNGILLFLVPNYLNHALHVRVSENGLYNSIIQLGSIVSMMFPAVLLSLFQSRFSLSLTQSNKIIFASINTIATLPLTYIALFHTHQVLMFAIARALLASNDVIIIGTIMNKYGPSKTSSIVFSWVNAVGTSSIFVWCYFAARFLDVCGETDATWTTLLSLVALAAISNATIYFFCVDSDLLELPTTSNVDCSTRAAPVASINSKKLKHKLNSAPMKQHIERVHKLYAVHRTVSNASSLASSLDLHMLNK